jgi:DNA primase
MNQEYHITEAQTATRTPESRYRGVSYTKPIDAAKEAVSVVDLAERLCSPSGLRRSGDTWAARCPLPEHEDKTPSFVVYPETESFFCFGCLHGGDVVELARLAWGYDEGDAHEAAAYLLLEFGHEVPRRPPAWYRKQDRQRHTREAIEETKKNIVRRRLFRHLILPLVDAIEDEEERGRELDRAWSDFRRLTA